MSVEYVLVVKYLVKGLPVIKSKYPVGSWEDCEKARELFTYALKTKGKNLGTDFTIESREW